MGFRWNRWCHAHGDNVENVENANGNSSFQKGQTCVMKFRRWLWGDKNLRFWGDPTLTCHTCSIKLPKKQCSMFTRKARRSNTSNWQTSHIVFCCSPTDLFDARLSPSPRRHIQGVPKKCAFKMYVLHCLREWPRRSWKNMCKRKRCSGARGRRQKENFKSTFFWDTLL